MADYNSLYTGAEIDDSVGKVKNADTTPTSGSTDMITSGAVYTALNDKLNLSGGTMTGDINMNSNAVNSATSINMASGGRVTNLATASDSNTAYAANVAYVLAKISGLSSIYQTISGLSAAVLAVVLTGLSTATNAAIEATDTIIVALGKLQAQINVRIQTNSEAQLKTLQITGGATLTNNEGNLTWNDTDKTLEFPVNADVTVQIGQEQLTYVKASENILNGEVVYASGAVGASGVIEVTKFIADGSINEIQVLGIATQDISLNGFGFITTFGKVRNIDTSAYSDGDILYASAASAGLLTATKPSAPNLAIPVAIVINSHAVNGTLMVRPTFGAQQTQTDFIGGVIEAPADGDYKLVVKLPYAATITETTTISTAGTCTATFKINTTALGGTANSVSTTEQSQTHSSSNVASAGDDIVLTISSNSSCEFLSFTIKFTRTLA